MMSKEYLISLFIGLIITVLSVFVIHFLYTKKVKNDVVENFEDFQSVDIIKQQFINKLLNLIENFSNDLDKLKTNVEKFSTYPDLDQIESSTLEDQLNETDERVNKFKNIIARNKQYAVNEEHHHDIDIDDNESDEHNNDEQHNDDDHSDDDDDDHDDDDADDGNDSDTNELNSQKTQILKQTVENFTNYVGVGKNMKSSAGKKKKAVSFSNTNKSKNTKRTHKTKSTSHGGDNHEHFVEGLTCGSTANCFHY